jgi:hypothetical protein
LVAELFFEDVDVGWWLGSSGLVMAIVEVWWFNGVGWVEENGQQLMTALQHQHTQFGLNRVQDSAPTSSICK